MRGSATREVAVICGGLGERWLDDSLVVPVFSCERASFVPGLGVGLVVCLTGNAPSAATSSLDEKEMRVARVAIRAPSCLSETREQAGVPQAIRGVLEGLSTLRCCSRGPRWSARVLPAVRFLLRLRAVLALLLSIHCFPHVSCGFPV